MKFINEPWFLRYSKSITKEIFENIIKSLELNGLKPWIHSSDWESTWEYFSKEDCGFLRSKVEPEETNQGDFCIDNNDQGISKEVFYEDFGIQKIYDIY